MDLHVVIKGKLHGVQELPPVLQNLPESAVIQHSRGLKRTENPHYHCWVPGVPDIAAFKAEMRSFYDKKLPDLEWKTHGNAYWTVKVFQTGYDDWLRYVIDPKEVKAPTWILWNRTGSPPEVPTERDLSELVLTSPTDKVEEKKPVKKQSLEKQLKFLNYVLDNSPHEDNNKLTPMDIASMLFKYCQFNGQTTEACCFTYVNFVLSHVHTGSKYLETQRAFADRITTRFFSNYGV